MINAYLIVFVFGLICSPYMFASIWENFINKYGDGIITRVIGPWLVLMLVYWIYGGLFLLVDFYKRPHILYNTKYQIDTSKNKSSIIDCVKQVLFNQIFLILPLFYLLSCVFPLKLSNSVPSVSSLLYQMIIVQLSGEVLYYCVHRTLHHRLFYRHIHKMHHDFKAPISIVSLYAHPLEIIFGNIFALVGPIFFFNCDLFSFYMFIIFGFIDSITDHCGYDIKQRDHDIHHEKTIYNYGSIGLLDYICGTNYITAMKNE